MPLSPSDSNSSPDAVIPPPPAGGQSGVEAFLRPFMPQLTAAGIHVPGMENAVTEIFLGHDILVMANALGDVCRTEEIYTMDREVVTVDADGRVEVMDPKRFVTWSRERVAFFKARPEGRRYETMTEQTAALVLRCDRFRSVIRRLEAIHPVRMPVFRADGSPELLPRGYDEASRIFTVRGALDFRIDMDGDEAANYFHQLLHTFPYGEWKQGMANTIAYFITLFCRAMLDGQKSPAFIFNANLVGSGKSIMAKMGLVTLYGYAANNVLWERTEDMKKELDSVAQMATPYMFFDNLGGMLKSPLLDAWMTTEHWSGRVLGTNRQFRMPTLAQVIVTGNSLKVSPDMVRRSVMIDLFAEETAAERPVPAIVITDRYLQNDGNRSKFLAALWALVRCALIERKDLACDIGKPLASFEAWSVLVATICVRMGFFSPLTPVKLPDAGDLVEEDAAKLVKAVIRAMKGSLSEKGRSVHVTLAEMVGFARLNDCFPEWLGTIDDIVVKLDGKRDGWKEQDYPDPEGLDAHAVKRRPPETAAEKRAQAAAWVEEDKGKQRGTLTSLGIAVRKRCGRKFHVENGVYQFGKRESSRLSTFIITRLE